MSEIALKIWETAYLLIQGVSKYEIMFVLGLGKFLPKAEKIKNIIEDENINLN